MLASKAEDIVQETLVKLWQLRYQLDTYEHPEALAIRMVKNLCIDQYRRTAIKQLSITQQRLLQLRSEDMALHQMAATCGLTYASTKSLLSMARKKLIDIMKGDEL